MIDIQLMLSALVVIMAREAVAMEVLTWTN